MFCERKIELGKKYDGKIGELFIMMLTNLMIYFPSYCLDYLAVFFVGFCSFCGIKNQQNLMNYLLLVDEDVDSFHHRWEMSRYTVVHLDGMFIFSHFVIITGYLNPFESWRRR